MTLINNAEESEKLNCRPVRERKSGKSAETFLVNEKVAMVPSSHRCAFPSRHLLCANFIYTRA